MAQLMCVFLRDPCSLIGQEPCAPHAEDADHNNITEGEFGHIGHNTVVDFILKTV